ncbi:hypothetical protein ABPG77_010495 [Micractinium sp. CCAP 211/92]
MAVVVEPLVPSAAEGRVLPTPPVAYNVRTQFGAKGDGRTDDSQALLRAVATANANPAGGVIFLPAGSYVLRWPLTITRSNVVLRGAGAGRTMIYITRALGDVFNGTWVLKPNGKIQSAWTAGGAFISFDCVPPPAAAGVPQRSRDTSTLLATITAPVPAGSIRLPVGSTARLQVGQRVRLFVNDASTLSEAQGRVAAGASGGPDAGSSASVTSVPVRVSGQPVPAWMAEDPVWQAAAEGQQALGPAGGDGLIYGEQMVDSGSGDVLDEDEVAFPARVTAVGAGWFEVERGIPFPVKPGWRATVHLDAPSLQNSGIESLAIRFKHTLAPEHFADRGYNGLQFSHVSNCWARNVTILNADNGLFVTWTDRSTFRGITVGMTSPRLNPAHLNAWNGHHAISVTSSHANLVASYRLPFRYIHDITLASAASLNVIADGAGIDTNLDMHRAASFGNLLTNLNLGLGSRPFQAGGRGDRGAHSGATSKALHCLPPCDWGPMLTFVGPFRGYTCPGKLWLVQAMSPGAPPNLYDAQRGLRRKREAAG